MHRDFGPQKNFHFTFHARDKMRHYRLSESRIRRVIHAPLRTEEGIAPDTVAVMQPASVLRSVAGKPSEWTSEIWVMVQDGKSQRANSKSKNEGKSITVISAWRYPGKTKERDPIPREIWQEMQALAR